MAVAKTIEITAGSPEGIEDAVRAGLTQAKSSLRNIEGVWLQDIKLTLDDGEIDEWRVTMKVTFVLAPDGVDEDEDEDEDD